MAKRVKDPEIRRKEILMKAQTLFFEKGYDKTSVQFLVDSLELSKGTFYYYFKSKDDLLSQVVDWRMEEVLEMIQALLADEHLSALEKMRRFLSSTSSWKSANPQLVMMMFRAIYNPDNILVRDRILTGTIDRVAPRLACILRQGMESGEFLATDPETTSRMIFYMAEGIGVAIYRQIMENNDSELVVAESDRLFRSYLMSIERILGIPEGTMKVYTLDQVAKILGGKNGSD